MKYVVSKGKDVDEAIDLGLKIMGVPKNEVNIEVVKSGKKSFLKRFSEEAVVKLTKNINEVDSLEDLINGLPDDEESKNSTTTMKKIELPEESVITQVEGKVWIKNGEIFCQTSGDNFPTITVPEHVTVLIDGEVFKGQTLIVLEQETYELKSGVIEQEMTWKVAMDSEKLRVLLHVEPGYRIDYTILDAAPNQHIDLLAKKNKQIQNTLKFEEVIEKMGLLGVKHGFNHDHIMKGIETIEPGVFVIAEGKSPVQGENGWFESKVSTKVRLAPKEMGDGRVDFREIKTIPHLDKGKLIGIIHPPVVGQIGYTVTNEPIPAKQTFPLKVQSGKEIVVIGEKIIAKESGRPQIEQKGLLLKVSIIQKYIHTGNIDLASGNISFKGDVEIFGEVTNQMTVSAAGQIEIHKTVNNAVVNSIGGTLLHSNSIGSKITAGNVEFFEQNLATQLESIAETVDEILEFLKAITSSETFGKSGYTRESIQPLLRILIDQKFLEFPQTIKDFINSISKSEVLEDKTWRRVSDSLSLLFLSLSVNTKFYENIERLIIDMKSLVVDSSETIYEKAFIITPNAMNSKLYCSGDISITDQGCINTEIQAGGYVQINGILRGGEVYGGLGVTVGEAGALSSAPTVIVVPGDQSIRIDKALEGVILKVGQDIYRFTETAFRVRAHINSEKRLVVDYTLNENMN